MGKARTRATPKNSSGILRKIDRVALPFLRRQLPRLPSAGDGERIDRPEPRDPVIGGSQDKLPVGAERGRMDQSQVACKRENLSAARRVPEAGGMVVGSRDHQPAVGTEGGAGHAP